MPRSYGDLLRNGYRRDRDFFVRTGNLENLRRCLLVAPHAGSIEPKTKEILLSVAKLGKWAYYVFEGKLARNNYRELHITSIGFDEPGLLELLPQTSFLLSFHGTTRAHPFVYVGGLFAEGREALIESLNEQRLQTGLIAVDATTKIGDEEIAGRSPLNITNRGLTGRGIQLEFAPAARVKLFGSGSKNKLDKGKKNLRLLVACVHGLLVELTRPR